MHKWGTPSEPECHTVPLCYRLAQFKKLFSNQTKKSELDLMLTTVPWPNSIRAFATSRPVEPCPKPKDHPTKHTPSRSSRS